MTADPPAGMSPAGNQTSTTNQKKTTMTIRQAARELDGIRNNRFSTAEELIARVDAIGHWAASQKNSRGISQILAEAADLHARLTGGPRSGRTTIVLN